MPEQLSATLLVVDDAEVNRYATGRYLRSAGYRVLDAATGEDALRLVESERPDLVLLDVNLPGISGIEVCRRIKAHTDTAAIMVLHVSASAIASDDRAEGLESGADGYLVEPVERRELLAHVQALLRIRRVESALRASNAALAEADQRKDEFLATLAHELRNPLGALSNALQVQDEIGSRDPQSVRQRETAQRQLRHLARLVDDLLDVSRMTRGKIELHRQRLPMAVVIEDAVQTSSPLFEERGQELTVSLPPEPLWVDGDPTRLEQIVCNLLNNAAKYTEPGGQVWLIVERAGPEVLIRVKDTGVGLAPETASRVFDLFMQADRSLDRALGGLGIGLTLVRSLVTMHGGSVSVYSEGEGHGSEFTVRLPRVESETPDAPAGPAARPAPPRPAAARRILIVEDNADARETLQDLLELWGHHVETASDGPQAVELARTRELDVLLIDIGLPGHDGYETARQIRAQPQDRPRRLVALTGYGGPEDRRLAEEAGFDTYLVKPVTAEELARVLGEG